VAGKRYHLQVSVLDCTGCNVCVSACPEDALRMTDIQRTLPYEVDNWEYAIGLPEHNEVWGRDTVQGSQWLPPLFEFSGACAGCGETPYIKVLTQVCGSSASLGVVVEGPLCVYSHNLVRSLLCRNSH
jgi:ferredoxin